MKKEDIKTFQYIAGILSQPNYFNIFETEILQKEKYSHERLGDGFELRLIEIKDSKGNVVENRDKYSHLFKDGQKVCDTVFRKGGLGGEFKDGYCQLIKYTQKEPHTEKKHGFDFGIHVIINTQGEVCLSGEGISSYPSHYGKNIGKLKDTFFNLLTKKSIFIGSSSDLINSKNFIILEHRYEWYNKELPLGVYKINKETCEIEKIDEIK